MTARDGETIYGVATDVWTYDEVEYSLVELIGSDVCESLQAV